MRPWLIWLLVLTGLLAVYLQQRHAGFSDHVFMGVPKADQLGGRTFTRVFENPGFLVGYSDVWKQALWVAYTVQTPEPGRTPPRPRFTTDYRAIGPVHPGDFANTGYERGHLAPNYAMARVHGPDAQSASFRMSNIAPQQRAFNRGVWQRLEEIEIDAWAAERGRLFVVVGPIFSAHSAILQTGVPVPDAFFRIVVDPAGRSPRAVAFVLPQIAPADAPLADYVVTVDDVEARTGFDFFRELDDTTEAVFEAAMADERWALAELGSRPPRYQ